MSTIIAANNKHQQDNNGIGKHQSTFDFIFRTTFFFVYQIN